ncbi:MAG: HI0074 family nucleotidyltransferase substrate-binding subunit [Candidatus Omnitrophota bacterium]
MERLSLKYKDALEALGTLKDILKENFSVIIRDASIQRFEYTFEAFWKFIKEHLKEKEGIIANSPKSCFRELFSIGFISEDETVKLQEMTDKRNDTSHTYKEKVAQTIYEKIPEYALLMEKILQLFKDLIEKK